MAPCSVLFWAGDMESSAQGRCRGFHRDDIPLTLSDRYTALMAVPTPPTSGGEHALFFVCSCVTVVRRHVRVWVWTCNRSLRMRKVCTIYFLPCVRTHQSPPSSPFIMHSWVSVSAGLWLAPNEQMTALSVSQCFDNKISQSVQKKHQSTTGTETSFNRSATAV